MNGFLEEYGEFIVAMIFATPAVGLFIYFLKYKLEFI